MRKNVGKIDRILRGSAAIIIVLLYFTKVIQGQAAILLGIAALLLLFTSISSFCPCYVRLNISTSDKKE
jgi:Inner membrane protein YgaP-like, transmembrane domain